MSEPKPLRGYFGIGVEGISKPMNLGAVLRTAHAFRASFAFAIQPALDVQELLQSDTSIAIENMPVQVYPDLARFALPMGCRLIGVEITEDAVDLPSFKHPTAAAYVLGAEQDRPRLCSANGATGPPTRTGRSAKRPRLIMRSYMTMAAAMETLTQNRVGIFTT